MAPDYQTIQNMPYRFIGNTGVEISPVALGGHVTIGGDIKDIELVKKISARCVRSTKFRTSCATSPRAEACL